MSNNLISGKHRRGELVRLTRGVYLKGDIARHCTGSDRAKAVTVALQKTRPTAVVSHQSAALLWGAPLHGNLELNTAREELEHCAGRGSQKLRVVAALMSPLSESPLESFARLRLYQGGIEQPVQQFEIVTPSGRLYRADFAWPHLKLLLEVDGYPCHLG